MKPRKRIALFVTVFALIAGLLAVPAFAQEPEDEETGIPAYAISRLKILAGKVYTRTPDSDWEEATTNTPLTPNSRVSVPEGSEAEIQFHGGQFVLLTPGTDVEVPEMSEDKTRFRLRAGEIRFDLPGDDFAPVAVRVPGGARTQFEEPGRYWLTVTDEDTTQFVVRRGKATISQEGEKHRLEEGQEATIARTITVGSYRGAADPLPPPEPLTEEERSAGVPPVVNYELRHYGDWVYAPTYGYVWRPRVASGWSPHVYGRWDWVAPYGWTWVSYEPWGWYPYHSGYWLNDARFGWVWTPYGSFVSAGFVWGFYDYYHHHHFFHHKNFRYRPSNARFIREGRSVRWAPLRPGERYRRPAIPRGDARLRSWNRPLESGRVFVAPRASAPAGQRQWRDVTAVRAERQQAITTSPRVGTRKDTRPVRPELTRPAPSGTRPSATTAPSRSVTPRATTPRSRTQDTTPQATTPRVTTPRAPSAPPRATTPRSSAPVPPVSPSREMAPARERATIPPVSPPREMAPARERATIPPVSPPREMAPARERATIPPVSPSREVSPPSRPSAPAPSTPAPSRSIGNGGSRGGDFDRGGNYGGDRGGGGGRGGIR